MAKKKSNLTPVTAASSDMKWRAESDARTLSEAEVIRNDKKRLNSAAKEGKRMGQEKMNEAKALLNLNMKSRPKF